MSNSSLDPDYAFFFSYGNINIVCGKVPGLLFNIASPPNTTDPIAEESVSFIVDACAEFVNLTGFFKREILPAERSAVRLRARLELRPDISPYTYQVIKSEEPFILSWTSPETRVCVPAMYQEGGGGVTENLEPMVAILGDKVHKSVTLPMRSGYYRDPASGLTCFMLHCTCENCKEFYPRGFTLPHKSDIAYAAGGVYMAVAGCRIVDRTPLRVIGHMEHDHMVLPTVGGCVIRDNVRYERSHIPVVFEASDPATCEFRVSDNCPTDIEMSVDGKYYGTIDMAVGKHSHAGVWWVRVAKKETARH